MKASELITLLQDAIDKYGDLPLSNDWNDRFSLIPLNKFDEDFEEEGGEISSLYMDLYD